MIEMKLPKIKIDGGTALRDAIMYSIGKLMALKLILSRLRVVDHKLSHLDIYNYTLSSHSIMYKYTDLFILY